MPLKKEFSKHDNIYSGKFYLAKNVKEVDEFCLRDFVGLIKLYNNHKFDRATSNSFS